MTDTPETAVALIHWLLTVYPTQIFFLLLLLVLRADKTIDFIRAWKGSDK